MAELDSAYICQATRGQAPALAQTLSGMSFDSSAYGGLAQAFGSESLRLDELDESPRFVEV